MENNIISDEARKARNKYLREWRAKNKEKVRAANLMYWERKVSNGRSAANLSIKRNAEGSDSNGR